MIKLPSKKTKRKLSGRHLQATLTEKGSRLLLQRYRWVQYTILIMGAVASAVLTASFLLGHDSSQEISKKESVRLDVTIADELEVAIEDRQTTYENPPRVSAGVFE